MTDTVSTRRTGEIVPLTDNDLRAIDNFDAAFRFIEDNYGDIQDISGVLGTGFTLLKSDDKARLLGMPFIIIEYRFHDGDFGDADFVAVHLVTKDNGKYIITDGSTGIRAQLQQLAADTGRFGGIVVHGGLRVSEYDTCAVKNCNLPRKASQNPCPSCGDESEKRGKGETYYISTDSE